MINSNQLIQKLGVQDTDVQANAMVEIVDQDIREAIPYLIPLLDSTDPEIRSNAAWSLGCLATENQGNIGDILLQKIDDPDELVRDDIIEALANLNYTPAIPKLQDIVLNDASALVRASATETLGYLQNKTSIPILESVLQKANEDESVRAYAANALGLLGDQQLISKLEQYINQETSLRVKAELLGAEYYLGVTNALKKILELLATADESLATPILNTLADLSERTTNLAEEVTEFKPVLQAVAERFPILQPQTKHLIHANSH